MAPQFCYLLKKRFLSFIIQIQEIKLFKKRIISVWATCKENLQVQNITKSNCILLFKKYAIKIIRDK